MSPESFFIKGNVFYCLNYDFGKGYKPKHKYVLFLNKIKPDMKNQPIILLPTSLTYKYQGNIFSVYNNNYCYSIPEDSLPEIFNSDTILDTSQITYKELDYFLSKRKKGALEYKGRLPNEMIIELERIIKDNITLPDDIIKKICD